MNPSERADLAEAQRIAKGAGLIVSAKRNSEGVILNWNIFRATQPHLTFIGQRVTPAGVLDLVRSAAGSRVTA